MTTVRKFRKNGIILLLACLAALCCSACSTSSMEGMTAREVIVSRVEYPPGTVDYIWEEPMVDVIDVPPGLDPEGYYYRPAHQSVVEIRQGRWRYFRQPKKK